MSLLALGLGLSLRHDTSEADAQVNASLSELSLKGVGRRGMRVTVGAVILDDQVAALTLSLEGLVVVAAILAGVSDLVFGAEEVDHLMQQGRAGGFLRAVDELGAEVDLIHALILGLPDLLGGAMAVRFRRGLNGDDRTGQLALEVDRVELVEDRLESGDRLAHLHQLGLVLCGRGLGLRLFGLRLGNGLDGLLFGDRLFAEAPAAIIGSGGHAGRLSGGLARGNGEDFAVLFIDLDDQADLVGLLVDDLLVQHDAHILHLYFLLKSLILLRSLEQL